MERLAVLRYASALFDIAVEKNQVKEFDQACTDISNAIASDSDLLAVVNHLSIPAHEKMATMKAIFEGKVPEDFIGIFDLVFRRRRQGELLGIFERFNELYKEYIKVATAELYSSAPLPQSKLNEIAEVLGKKLDKTIEFNQHIDPALIAGFRVEVDGHVFDSSLKKQVALLRKQLEIRS
jgi:F-type H+-transporting ATPase subunit delta